ncbi:MAG: divalent-cation tolerance protein CutA [Candidatus Omnitrophica bacterium]|nr:divalent-cation tolerance protein CutA [Candidatus Omnitrophota bacterium]
MQYVIVFITTINKKEAEKISKALLDKRIIACSNIIGDIESHFWWKGKKEKAKECLLLVKTSMAAFKKVLKVVKSLHSYEVPEIIAVPIIAGYKPYLEWIKESTS